MAVADHIAKFLKDNGIRHIFGLPGGENVTFLDALRRAGLEFILMHHEVSAGFAADVTGQLTDRPGVCLSTVGPGAINLLAGASSATLERSPVIAITAEIDIRQQDRVTHMKLDLENLFSIACKSSFRVTPDNVDQVLNQGWHLALSPPRGAVHMALSPEVASSTLTNQPETKPERHKKRAVGTQIDAIKKELQSANQVMILAGLGVEADRAHQQLISLADAWQAPVAVTPKAKGHFKESHPLYAGCFTAYGDLPLRQALDQTDLILGVGLDGVDFVTSYWEVQTPIINLNTAQAWDPVTNPVLAADDNLCLLLDALSDSRRPMAEGQALTAYIRRQIQVQLDTKFPINPGKVRLAPLITAIQHALPETGAITLDVGVFKLVFLQAWHTDQPKSLFVANGLSAMGYALPGAMAIKLAQPERPVMAIVGDGALLMYAGELETISRLGIPIVVLVVVDDALSLIRLKQIRNSVPISGTEFGPMDYQSLARAFACDYHLIDRESGAVEVLHAAIESNRPTLVEARVDKSEYDHFK